MSFVVTGLRPGLIVTAVLLVVLVLPFVIRARDIPLRPRERAAVPPRVRGCGGSGSRRAQYPDFAWAWLTRFLMMLGNAMATLYLLFWLQDEVGLLRSRSRARPC